VKKTAEQAFQEAAEIATSRGMSHEEVSAAAWNALSSVTKASAEAAKAAISNRFHTEQAVAAAERAAARASSSSNLENIQDAYQKSAGASNNALHGAGFLQTEASPRGRFGGRRNRHGRYSAGGHKKRNGHVQVHRDGDKTDVDIDEDKSSLQQMTDDSSEEVQEAKTEADDFFAEAKNLEDNVDAFVLSSNHLRLHEGFLTLYEDWKRAMARLPQAPRVPSSWRSLLDVDAAPGAAPGADALLSAEGYGHRGHGRHGRRSGHNQHSGHVQVHRTGEHTDVDVEEDQQGSRR